MTAPSLAALGTDFYVPAYEVRVGGRPIDRRAVRDILSVSYTDSLEDVDAFVLEVNNWDEEARTLRYAGGRVFTPGERVELRLGYLDAGLVRVLTGEITTLKHAFPAEAPPKLTVRALGLLHRFRTEARSRPFEGLTDTQIARAVAEGLGVELRTDPAAAAREQPNPYVLQHNQQDIAFLQQRARRIGYELTAQEAADGAPYLYFAPPAAGIATPFRLEWGRSLLAFDPTITTARQVGEVTVRAWHPTRGELIEVTVNRGELGGDEPFLDAFSERREVIADHPVTSEAEARTLALETLRANALDMVTASGTTLGMPRLRAGTRVEIGGTGDGTLDGVYFVTGTTHALGNGGYTTAFEAKREGPP